MTVYNAIKKLGEAGYIFSLGSGAPEPEVNMKLREGANKPDPDVIKPLLTLLKENKAAVINILKDEITFNSYLANLREANKYDPRPDLSGDTQLWQAVLKEAEQVDNQVYSNLHGFRIAGCRLKMINDKLSMVPGEAIGGYWPDKSDFNRDRNEYLLPYKDIIKSVFDKAAEKINILQ